MDVPYSQYIIVSLSILRVLSFLLCCTRDLTERSEMESVVPVFASSETRLSVCVLLARLLVEEGERRGEGGEDGV